jgi:hypothetical protein
MSFRSCIGDGIALPGAHPGQRQTKAMIFPLFRREPCGPDTISTLYGTIVAQARFPVFYRDYAVPDTVNGRFDLLVLHLVLVIDRLTQDPELQRLGQGVFDRFCEDMDDNLREMGVGDLESAKGDAARRRSVLWPCAGLSGGAGRPRQWTPGCRLGTEYLRRIADTRSGGTPACGLCAGSGT